MTDAVAKAKDTLLRTLEELEEAQETLEGTPDGVDLVVVYSIGMDLGDGGWYDVGGYASTAGPDWAKAKLCERAAKAFDHEVVKDPDEPDEPDTFGSG